MNNRYLEILGLAPGATERDIKAAYRRLAKKYHPDTSDEPDAEARFIEITEAYNFLLEVGPTPNEETTAYEYNPYAEEYEARRARARAYARQKAAEAAKNRAHTLRQFYRVTTPLMLIAALFDILLVLDYVIPAQKHDEKVQRVYRVFATSTRGGDQTWSYDAIEFDHFTLQVGRKKAVGLELPTRAEVAVTPLLRTIKRATFQTAQEEIQLKPAYGFYRVFGLLIPMILAGSFFYFWLPYLNEHKITASIITLIAFAIQLFLF